MSLWLVVLSVIGVARAHAAGPYSDAWPVALLAFALLSPSHAATLLGSAVTPLDGADAGSCANVRDVAARLGSLVVAPHTALSLRAALSLDGGTDLVLWNGDDVPVRLDLATDATSRTARWTAADGAVLPRASRLLHDPDGALVRRCADGREELVAPRPPRRPPLAGVER